MFTNNWRFVVAVAEKLLRENVLDRSVIVRAGQRRRCRAAPTSTGTWVIVDKGLSPAAKNAQPLDRVSPMQHGVERMVNPVLPLLRLADLFLLDLSPVLLPYPRQNHTP